MLDSIRWALFQAPRFSNGIELKGYTLEVLLCLAEHARKGGGNAYPSRERIASELWGGVENQPGEISEKKWREATDQRVKRAFRDLQKGGWISESLDKTGLPFGARSKVWTLNLGFLRAGEFYCPGKGDMGVPPKGDMGVPPKGDMGVPPKGDMGVRQGGHGRPVRGTQVSDKGYTGDPLTGNKGFEEGGEGESESTFSDPLDALAADYAETSRVASDGKPETGVHGSVSDPRCDEHAGLARRDVPPCWKCAEARKWLTEEAERSRVFRRAAIDACDLCDDNGMRSNPGGLTRCNHEPEPAIPWEPEPDVVLVPDWGSGVEAPF